MSTPNSHAANQPAASQPVTKHAVNVSNPNRPGNFTAEDISLSRADILAYLDSGDLPPMPQDVKLWLMDAGYSEEAAGKVVSDLDSYR